MDENCSEPSFVFDVLVRPANDEKLVLVAK